MKRKPPVLRGCMLLIPFVLCLMWSRQSFGQQQATQGDQQKVPSGKALKPANDSQYGVVVSVPLVFSLEEAASGKIDNPKFGGTAVKVRLKNGKQIEATATEEQMRAVLGGKTNATLQKANNKGWKVVSLAEPTRVSATGKEVKGKTAQIKKTAVDAPAPLLAGQVRGVLYDSSGARFAEGVSVFAADVTNEEKNQLTIKADLKYKTNSRGQFILENVAEGRHGLCIFIPPKQGQYGNIIIGLIVNKTKPTYFTMPAAAGIDLGNVEVTSVIKGEE